MKPSYFNKKGNKIELRITLHAKRRFVERWEKLFPGVPLEEDVEEMIARWFSHANRIKNFSGKEKNRLQRYGKDTLFFRHSNFTFVVQNAEIVTIEISDRGMRHLNSSLPFGQ